jgi:hypothetical protein
MAVETKAGWIFAARQLDEAISTGSGVPAATETTNGTVKQVENLPVPATFADEAAVRTYLNTLVTAMITAGQMSAS